MRRAMLFLGIAVLIVAVAAIGARPGSDARQVDESPRFKMLGKAGIPHQLNYQGYLTDDAGDAITDTLGMTFSIWDAASGGSQLWDETQAEVAVIDGLFNVLLGSVTEIPSSVFTSPGCWIEIEIEGETLTPRTQIVSVGYAFRADTADYAIAAHSDNDWQVVGNDMYSIPGGNVGIGTTAPDEKLEIIGNMMLNTSHGVAFVGEVKSSRADGGLYVRQDSGAHLFLGYGNTVVIKDDNVGIGTASPGAKLHVEGGDWVTFFSPTAGGYPQLKVGKDNDPHNNIILGFHNTDNYGYLAVAGDPATIVVKDGGNVGIGETSPAYKLDVEGYVQAQGYYTGDIIFQKDNQKLWRMYEGEDGLYLESLKTGKIYRFVLEEVNKK